MDYLEWWGIISLWLSGLSVPYVINCQVLIEAQEGSLSTAYFSCCENQGSLNWGILKTPTIYSTPLRYFSAFMENSRSLRNTAASIISPLAYRYWWQVLPSNFGILHLLLRLSVVVHGPWSHSDRKSPLPPLSDQTLQNMRPIPPPLVSTHCLWALATILYVNYSSELGGSWKREQKRWLVVSSWPESPIIVGILIFHLPSHEILIIVNCKYMITFLIR